ncbi:sigma-70 family RNA polymerase sigma factor [Haloferula chungangensis]|uniref:Sigma-70 family RNA polymerase sigma factor n=1 Tax=Haloferula chungangensis TaxID=1048331 RepID=A0ABW2L930_9BACT
MPHSASAINLERLSSHELRNSILRFVQSRVRDPHLAEDLTQEILLRGLSKLSGLRDQKRLEAWLFQIARNTISDHFRKSKATEISIEKMPENCDPNEAITEEEVLLRENIAAYIRGVVEALPEIYRNALCYTEYEGHTQVELAKKEGISLSGAKSRVQRARQEVRTAVEQCCHVETDRYGQIVEMKRR